MKKNKKTCYLCLIHLHIVLLCSRFLVPSLPHFLLSVSGSIYEISGSEVCFSTGDLIKVIGTELLSVCCEDISSNKKFELPINHTGRFELWKGLGRLDIRQDLVNTASFAL